MILMGYDIVGEPSVLKWICHLGLRGINKGISYGYVLYYINITYVGFGMIGMIHFWDDPLLI